MTCLLRNRSKCTRSLGRSRLSGLGQSVPPAACRSELTPRRQESGRGVMRTVARCPLYAHLLHSCYHKFYYFLKSQFIFQNYVNRIIFETVKTIFTVVISDGQIKLDKIILWFLHLYDGLPNFTSTINEGNQNRQIL